MALEAFSARQIVFLALVFVVVGGLPLVWFFVLKRERAISRLASLVDAPLVPVAGAPQSVWVETVVRAATPLARISLPDEGWEDSALRRRFMQAGLRSPRAPIWFFAAKTLFGLGVPLALWLGKLAFGAHVPPQKFFALVGLLSGAGFYAPNFVLMRRTRLRQQRVVDAFPDALDLLTICVEAGLGFDAALNRVSREMASHSPVVATELHLVCLEFRAGLAKERALRNLALRTGVEDVETLVAMLVQSEKLGTGLAEALRVYADMLRTKRRQRAEERAAKVAVKLIFPLVLCIFPAIMVVVGGPAMIRIVKTLPTLVGG